MKSFLMPLPLRLASFFDPLNNLCCRLAERKVGKPSKTFYNLCLSFLFVLLRIWLQFCLLSGGSNSSECLITRAYYTWKKISGTPGFCRQLHAFTFVWQSSIFTYTYKLIGNNTNKLLQEARILAYLHLSFLTCAHGIDDSFIRRDTRHSICTFLHAVCYVHYGQRRENVFVENSHQTNFIYKEVMHLCS